jgi:hypothetical protein
MNTMAKKSPVPFRWEALMLSSLAVPAPFGLLFALGSVHPVYAFMIGAIVGYIVGLATTSVFLLPALWLLSWVTPIKGWQTTLLGGVIAFLLFVGWDRMDWGASGVDSGPPDTTYAQWIAKNWLPWEIAIIIGAGIVTAAAYHLLCTRKGRPVTPAA